ncbi:hypothetical protein BC835DRAFT_1317854 [Cytidiella melzeri]|nr:hypothetical protein BC835DRAFT_1317854 [Cytidiella melzeri]
MTTTHALSVSPTSSTFMHIPTTPKDSVVKPNPHPYAIRTTSTGLLTRSNSSGHNVAASRHHYIPLSPAPNEPRKRHRYTKSLTQEPSFELKMPSPLPVPATFTGNARGQSRAGWSGSIRSSRSVQDSVFLSAATLEDLPSNPKLWTTSQLSAYLATALRVPSENTDVDTLPASTVEEIIVFTKEANINGRIFLRLIEDDLDKRGIDPAWRDALLTASRNLRQNVIKGRIWGGDADLPESPSPSLPSHPFSSALYNSSSSSIDLTDEDEEGYRQRRRRRGRVHGMVQSFERSGSFSSESSMEPEESQGREERGSWLKGTNVDEAIILSPVSEPIPLEFSSSVLPATEEPTVAALLAESERSGTWGARAWEELDVAPGVTVKRVEESPGRDLDIRADTVSRLQTMAAFGTARTAKSVRLPKGKQDRRVVTAIFTPPVDETLGHTETGASAATANEVKDVSSEHSTPQRVAKTKEARSIATERERALEAELAETRALVHAFRARLEEVERKVADLEVEIQRKETSHQKFLSLGALASGSGDDPDMFTDAEHDAAVSHISDTSTSTLLEVDDESIEGTRVQHHQPMSISASAPRESSVQEAGARHPDDDVDPSSVSELPHYVLLVGLGVCAVVLRVILGRANSRGSWRL